MSVRVWIVVPCYNEEQRLDVAAFESYLGSVLDVGFVFVNDGSTDGTLDVLGRVAERWPARIRVLDQQPNQGKAEAVRVGMLAALESGAAYAGYFDADLATPLDAIAEFIQILDEQPHIDLALGSRVALLGRMIDRKPARHYLGRVFATAASLVLSLPVYDTQCGAKLLRNGEHVRSLFATPFGSRWIFDVELIARYLTCQGAREGIFEIPLRRWTDVGDSRVKGRDFLRAAGEMATIYRTYSLHRDFDALLRLLSSPAVLYAGVGALGTALHYLTLTVLVELAGAEPATGTAAGAVAGAALNYVLNYHFTFASKAPHARTLPRYLAVAALSAGLNWAGMRALTAGMRVHYLIAQVFCTVAVLVIGYLLNRMWTFGSSAHDSANVRPAQRTGPTASTPSPAGGARSESARRAQAEH